jgi:hypothetical protein
LSECLFVKIFFRMVKIKKYTTLQQQHCFFGGNNKDTEEKYYLGRSRFSYGSGKLLLTS